MHGEMAGKQKQFTGWHMLAVIVTFFSVVIAVNIWLAVSSARTWTGLVVPNSYVASQEFNTKQKIALARQAAGWQGGFDYLDNQVVFHLVDAKGQPIDLEGVHVEINRPVGIKGDTTLELVRQPDGGFSAPLALESGVWNAEIVALIKGEPDYEHRARFVIAAKDKVQ